VNGALQNIVFKISNFSLAFLFKNGLHSAANLEFFSCFPAQVKLLIVDL